MFVLNSLVLCTMKIDQSLLRNISSRLYNGYLSILFVLFLLSSHSVYSATFDCDVTNSKNIVFIDQGVSDWSMLVDGVLPGHEIVILDAKCPALEQMTEALQRLNQDGTGIDSIHIISHGKPGALVFASSEISEESIQEDSSQLSLWENLLTVHSTIYT